jgi:ELWxxDGT repeat protein
VKDINLGPGDANSIYLTPIGGRLFFVADDGQTGAELWLSDGTTDGTRKIKDIRADTDPTISSLTAVGGMLFFAANMGTDLWRSDGTVTGTLSLGDFSYVANLTAVGDILFFEAENSACPVHGLWKSDGTPREQS